MATTSKDLLQQQLEEATSRVPVSKSAKAVEPDRQAAIQYNADLQKLVGHIKRDIDTVIVPMLRTLKPQFVGDSGITDGWAEQITAALMALTQKWTSAQISKGAALVASRYVQALNETNKTRFVKTMQPIGIDVFGDSPNIDNILQAATANNVQLIKSIPQQYLGQVDSIVLGNMRAGLRPSAIVDQLSNQYGVTKRRAALIARDQTLKANGELTKQRQEDAGFEFFRWADSDDSRVRDEHEDIANRDIGYGKGVYRWDDPPKNRKGQPIFPGMEVQCRCNAIPVRNAQVIAYRKENGLPPLKLSA
jgi:SPP1 gp7 family putative phage head morphogenesis protein